VWCDEGKERRPAAVKGRLTPQRTTSSKKGNNRQNNRHKAKAESITQTTNNKQQTLNSRQQAARSRQQKTEHWELGRTRTNREASAHVGSIAGAPPGRARVLR
jgi:hypothetical protein